jgi:adenosylhomocysteinase
VSRIDWVLANCRLLAAIGEEFDRTHPFAGLTIGTGIHLEPKTVALLLRRSATGWGCPCS